MRGRMVEKTVYDTDFFLEYYYSEEPELLRRLAEETESVREWMVARTSWGLGLWASLLGELASCQHLLRPFRLCELKHDLKWALMPEFSLSM